MPKTEFYPLIVPLYQHGYLQTIWSAREQINKEQGWTLKNKSWAPWFFNMRPVGDSPKLFYDICTTMAFLTTSYETNLLIGVEMAGLTPLGGAATIRYGLGNPIRIGYTRPLPQKVRTPEETAIVLNNLSADVAGYGQKDYVEGRIKDGDIIGIFDDMATDLGSKLIARLIVLWQAKMKGISVTCDHIFYFLNRNLGTLGKVKDFASNTNPDLYPAELTVDYVIEFMEAMPLLKGAMTDEEFKVISDYQAHPDHFQDPAVQQEVLKLAHRANS